MLNHILTAGGIHMVIDGMPVTVAKSDKFYPAIVEALNRKATAEEITCILEEEKRRMTAAVEVAPDIELKSGQLYYKGEAIAGVLGTRMMQMVEEGFDLTAMAQFLANLLENPSKRVVDHLYGFLEHGKNPITEDGHFLAYKAVRSDFKDIHSGTFNNAIGCIASMPRNRVDENPNNTCSAGLHVCSYDYLPHFANAQGHVMVCKVNPADVVAVPVDYNNTKMRVCRYEVVAEHTGYYKAEGDTLSATSVATEAGGTFLVEIDGGSGFYTAASYDRLSDAAQRMDDLLENVATRGIRLSNVKTGQVIEERENDDFEDDDSCDDELTFSIVGIDSDGEHQLENDFDDVADAVGEALGYDGYVRIEIRDSNGTVVKTLT